MKKFKRILFRAIGLISGIIIIAALIYYLRFRHATGEMTPSETMAINDSVWCIRDKFVNAYIFRGNKSYLMVDAGFSKNNFKAQLNKLAIEPSQITCLFLTHTDGDHISAIPLLLNAAIYMHKDEEQMINGTTGKTKYFKTKWKYGKYNLLNDNDSLSIDGLKIKILHTPGHTPGSSCYVINGDYLLTGDNLVLTNGKYEHFIEMFNMNTPEQIESLKLLPPPGTFKYVLTAHYGFFKKF